MEKPNWFEEGLKKLLEKQRKEILSERIKEGIKQSKKANKKDQ